MVVQEHGQTAYHGRPTLYAREETGMSYPVREAAQPSRNSYVVASFGRRLGAFLLDLFGICMIAGAIGAALSLPGMATGSVANTGWGALMVGLVSAPYCIGMWWLGGATRAQMALGVHVLRATGPQRLSLGAAVLRWALLFGVVSGLGALGGLNYAVAGLVGWVQPVWLIALIVTTARDPMKRGLHDRLAGSLVVRTTETSAADVAVGAGTFGPGQLIRLLSGGRQSVQGESQALGQAEGPPAGALPDVLKAIDGVSNHDRLPAGGSDGG
jgi:uncharacterized RDD family membrane protein YckC